MGLSLPTFDSFPTETLLGGAAGAGVGYLAGGGKGALIGGAAGALLPNIGDIASGLGGLGGLDLFSGGGGNIAGAAGQDSLGAGAQNFGGVDPTNFTPTPELSPVGANGGFSSAVAATPGFSSGMQPDWSGASLDLTATQGDPTTFSMGGGASGGAPAALNPMGGGDLTPLSSPANSNAPNGVAAAVLRNMGVDPTGGVGGAIEKNAGLLLPAGLLGYRALAGDKIPRAAQLEGSANDLSGQSAALRARGNELLAGATTGQLPAGAENAISSAAAAAKARTRQQYAGMGLGGSTMEAQALAGIDQQVVQQKFNVAQDLAKTGLQALQVAGQESADANRIYTALMNSELQQDEALQDAIAEFAMMAAGGGSRGTTIQLGGTRR